MQQKAKFQEGDVILVRYEHPNRDHFVLKKKVVQKPEGRCYFELSSCTGCCFSGMYVCVNKFSFGAGVCVPPKKVICLIARKAKNV